MSTKRPAIVLVHGLWVTPRSWDSFRRHYENLGYEVLTPAWPGIHGEAAEMRRDPSGLNGVGAKVFANTLSETEVKAAYEEFAIPASGRSIYQASLANFTPHAATTIDFNNSKRAPLLFIGGEKDVIMPAALNRKNFRKYRSSAATEYKEFPGRSHYIIAETGWEEVADYALQWALGKSRTI